MTIPIDYLYIGTAGEHYVMAECYRNRLEAFKLPIDKGFDIVITQGYKYLQSRQVSTSELLGAELSVFGQVKSLRARIVQADDEGVSRPTWRGAFRIKNDDLNLLCKTRNSALICVLFFDSESEHASGRTAYAWWLSSDCISELKTQDYFVLDPNDSAYRQLNVNYVESNPNASSRQNTYISLLRQSHSKDALPGDLASGSMISKSNFDFSGIVKIGSGS